MLIGLGLQAVPCQAAKGLPTQPPIMIARQGFFFAGGHAAPGTPNRLVDQIYVEYQVPAHQTYPYPLVLIHGGGVDGAYWHSTPDGREGWATYFVRQGFAVYVVDLATVGRSPYDEDVDGPKMPLKVGNNEAMLTRPQAYGLWPQAKLYHQFPGPGDQSDPAYQQYAALAQAWGESPRPDGPPPLAQSQHLDLMAREGVDALLHKIGPAVLVTHSRAGAMGWVIADGAPGLVKRIVAVEPNGPPFYNAMPGQKSGPIARPWGISYAPLTFDPPVTDPSELAPDKQLPPQAPDLAGCWAMKAPQRRLANLTTVPVMVVTGEASFHAGYDRCTVTFLRNAGVPVTEYRLGEHGIHGNGHLMLIEKNNAVIAARLENWLRDRRNP